MYSQDEFVKTTLTYNHNPNCIPQALGTITRFAPNIHYASLHCTSLVRALDMLDSLKH